MIRRFVILSAFLVLAPAVQASPASGTVVSAVGDVTSFLSDIPGRISAAEDFLGITPAQRAKWQDFTTAVIRLMAVSVPPDTLAGLEREAADILRSAREDFAKAAGNPLLGAMMGDAWRQVEALKDLQRTGTELLRSLTPEQADRLRDFLRTMPFEAAKLIAG